MRSFSELESVIAQGEFQFQKFIQFELERDKHFLRRRFLLKTGEQLTILNYLIRKHEPLKGSDMLRNIHWLLEKAENVISDQPIHLLMRLRKTDLWPIFVNLEADDRSLHELQLDCRDNEGQTLLSRALTAGEMSCISDLIALNADLQESSKIKFAKKTLDLQPLHQSILMNFSSATKALIRAGAPVETPCGPLEETPLLLASRHGKIDALAALLASSTDELDLEYKNINGTRAIDLLCLRLQKGANTQNALRGIAMLLCHGAEVPRRENFRSLLEEHRLALLDEVKNYSHLSGCSPATFVRACHDRHNRLHDIIYAKNSWIESLKRTLGFSSREAYLVESLVFDPSSSDRREPIQVGEELSPREASQRFSEEERQFAEFTWRYRQDFTRFFKNPFSTMNWKLTSGKYTSIEQVRRYVDKHHQDQDEKKTRSELLLDVMDGKTTSVHDNLIDQSSIRTIFR